MEENYEDDTHYCLKCHSTIIGLDNYVNHRKLLCITSKPNSTKIPTEGSITLKADDFFSSLELQSSSKKTTNHVANNNVKASGIKTRSKTHAVLHATSTNKESQLKSTETTSWTPNVVSKTSKKVIESDSEQESVEEVLEDEESEEEDEEDGFGNVPPKSFTGGKWKPHSPIQWYGMQTHTDDRDWNPHPSPTHTGGKWKPTVLSKEHTNFTSEPPPPPPSYTKGKWKPSLEIKTATAPPPSHTRGKWKPKDKEDVNIHRKIYGRPFVKSNGRIQYWCGPCNRRLSSKIVYNRHLKSELHLKRTNDGDFEGIPRFKKEKCKIKKPSRTIDQNLSGNTFSVKKRKRKKIYKQCDVCRSRVNMKTIGKHLISHYHCRRGNLTDPETQQLVLDNIHNIVLQSPFQCAPCKFYCNTQETFLQHWTSTNHKCTNDSYFNCSFCKYNCNESDEMYQHLISQEHVEVISVINGSVPIVIKRLYPVKCTTCEEEFLFNIQLRKHCEKVGHSFENTASDSHQSKFNCSKCEEVFKSAIAHQRHMLFVHKTSTFICGICSLRFDDIKEAKSHRRTWQHRQKFLERKRHQNNQEGIPRECNFCSKSFSKFSEMKQHLMEEHPEVKHSCPYCGKVFNISQELSVHIRSKACSFTENEERDHSCKECPFKCDSLSSFLYHNALHGEPLVLYPPDSSKKPTEQYKCPDCDKFYPKSSLLCHIRLHTYERPFVCKVCRATFTRKNNLLYHMKKHDKREEEEEGSGSKEVVGEGEKVGKLHLCSTCGASFSKRFVLLQHMTRHTGKLHRCPKENCVFSARTAAELKPHLFTHGEEKPYTCEQCDYRGKTKRQLIRHLSVHDPEKKFHCFQCSFSTRFASHLRRHQRLHTGAKPYACPHCDHRCNTLENLRKHVLSTSKHPGKCIYECKFCDGDVFRTNFAKEYKVHLINEHPDALVSSNEATSYVAGIYEAGNDTPALHVSLEDTNERQNEKSAVVKSDQITINLAEGAASASGSGGLCPTGNNDIGSTILLTSVSVQDGSEHKIQDELFPMFIVSKEVRVENMTESWTMEENYDVEESGVLIPFQSEGDSLFNEHF